MSRVRHRLDRLVGDETGVSAVEFAILLPMFLILFFAGFAITNTVALSRKVTITTRALGDLVSQYKDSMAQADMTAVMNASAQIVAPFDSTPLAMRISEITTDATGAATVTWSSGSNMTPYKAKSAFTLPTGMFASINVSFIYAETSYVYTPPFGTSVIGTINLGDRIYMMPRKSTSISYSGS